ncbi:hypothetical protein GOP47_0022861 [Adiantum capillus-veneris]|uniref:Uncharacterized protein n=1 Tax=Adiantum capillus-veneris TaxID=13818 RepID=A0A9D4U7A5_ADICA|nr:hypothetical protein GOP47_0022861 [Adiantum capillus-veneris]
MFQQQRRHVLAVVVKQRKRGGGAGKVTHLPRFLFHSRRPVRGIPPMFPGLSFNSHSFFSQYHGMCALKKVESPSTSFKETSSWDKMIHRRFTIQIIRSLRTTSDGSYVAAIFSANYEILRKHAPVKPLDSKVFLQNSSKTGSTKESLETIDILELMKGLGEEDVSANFENLHEFSSNLVLPKIKQTSSTILCCKPSDKLHATDVVSANKKTRKQRPKSSSSINLIGSVEDVDMALSARRGITLSPLMSSREVRQHLKKMMVAPFGQTIFDQNIHPHDENGVISIPKCTSIATIDDPLSEKRETLQREIFFKYMFNHNSGSERKNSLFKCGCSSHTDP